MQNFKWTAWIFVLFLSLPVQATEFRDNYLSLNAGIMGANGIVTNDLRALSVDYQYIFDYVDVLATKSEYHWYLDFAFTASYYELEDPLANMGILDTPRAKENLEASNYSLELGISRRQRLYDFSQWLLGVRLGVVLVQTTGMGGFTQSAVQYDVNSSSSLGMTINAFSGVSWDISENYSITTLFQLRKHYQADFAVRDEISKRSHRYPDYTSIGFSIGLARGF